MYSFFFMYNCITNDYVTYTKLSNQTCLKMTLLINIILYYILFIKDLKIDYLINLQYNRVRTPQGNLGIRKISVKSPLFLPKPEKTVQFLWKKYSIYF